MAQFSGAFDLSTMASSPSQANASYVTEVTEATFDQTMRKSISYPIVVEFYSSQAPESKQMGETLTRLANAAGGSWLLARMNIDAAPQIVQALKITAVPFVAGVLNGQMVPLWQGSLAQEDASKVISQLLQMAAGNGIIGKAEPQGTDAQMEGSADTLPPEDPKYTPAYNAMEQGDFDKALESFSQLLDANPGDAEARIGKAQAGLLSRVSKLDPDKVKAASEDESPTIDAVMDAADLDVALGQAEQGFARLISAIAGSSPEDRERLRLRVIELFDTQDPTDKMVLTARRNLATALF